MSLPTGLGVAFWKAATSLRVIDGTISASTATAVSPPAMSPELEMPVSPRGSMPDDCTKAKISGPISMRPCFQFCGTVWVAMLPPRFPETAAGSSGRGAAPPASLRTAPGPGPSRTDVRERQRHFQCLLHEQDRRPPAVDRAQDLGEVLDEQGRQPFRRLVHQHDGRARHEPAPDRQHLLLAARQVAAAMGDALAQAGGVRQDLLDAPLAVGAGAGEPP